MHFYLPNCWSSSQFLQSCADFLNLIDSFSQQTTKSILQYLHSSASRIITWSVSRSKISQGTRMNLQLDQYHGTKNHSYSSPQPLYFLATDYVHWTTVQKKKSYIMWRKFFLKDVLIIKLWSLLMLTNLGRTSADCNRFKSWDCRCNFEK